MAQLDKEGFPITITAKGDAILGGEGEAFDIIEEAAANLWILPTGQMTVRSATMMRVQNVKGL